jgi:hypothetical protein
MARSAKPEPLVELDLNSPVFQSVWDNLELVAQEKVFATFEKIKSSPGIKYIVTRA